MSNLERITNRLNPLIAALKENPHVRVQMAVDDCLDETISDKDRLYAYGYTRKTAARFGYGEYLPNKGSREVDPALVDANNHIATNFTSFVQAGLAACPEVLQFWRPKKNQAGVVQYTEETLIKTLVASCQKWHRDQYKNKAWDGKVETIGSISLPVATKKATTENKEANSEEE